MNISTKPPDPLVLGYFFRFSLSELREWNVVLDAETPFRITVNVALPESCKDNWLNGFHSILRRLQCGNSRPVRLDYDNCSPYFSIAQLEILEKKNPSLNFYLYRAPLRIASPAVNKTHIQQKRERYARERINRQKERESAVKA